MEDKKLLIMMLMLVVHLLPMLAQDAERLMDSLQYRVEAQGTVGSGDYSPLWLNANRYGLSSVKSNYGYLRGSVERPLKADDGRRWGVGYGVDAAVTTGMTSTLVVQQAFVEARWLKGVLSVGSREQPLALKNVALSSGSQTLGINARPVPQIRLSLPDYWAVPYTRGWVGLKGHLAYGMLTDDGWQKDFTRQLSKYTAHTLVHTKAGYLRIGKPDRPLTVELGLEMACQFGGTSYHVGDYEWSELKNASGLKSFINALIPGGGEVVETTYANEEGNQLGSWMARVNYETADWKVGVYGEKFFEDESAMFLLDYDGYGTGDEWNVKKKNRYFLYDLKDMMLGAELNLKHGTWVRDIVVEYLYTKYQSGAVYHDRTPSIPDHLGGLDDYCNHYIYAGWQHWGQVMGNPFYLSPLYNSTGEVKVKNTRFRALHLGLSGRPTSCLSYRLLASWQDGLGTYKAPYTKQKECTDLLVEVTYTLPSGKMTGWSVTGAFGADFGDLRGDNQGFQLTITKKGLFRR